MPISHGHKRATSELRAADQIACGVPEDMVELRAGYLRAWSNCVRGTCVAPNGRLRSVRRLNPVVAILAVCEYF